MEIVSWLQKWWRLWDQFTEMENATVENKNDTAVHPYENMWILHVGCFSNICMGIVFILLSSRFFLQCECSVMIQEKTSGLCWLKWELLGHLLDVLFIRKKYTWLVQDFLLSFVVGFAVMGFSSYLVFVVFILWWISLTVALFYVFLVLDT